MPLRSAQGGSGAPESAASGVAELRCQKHGYVADDDICDCLFCRDCGAFLVADDEIESGLCMADLWGVANG